GFRETDQLVPDRKLYTTMKRILSRKPSPALAVSFIALFVALGGVSYGVATGSIDSRAIKDNTIRAQDIRANAITESEVRRRSLDGTDIKIERVGGNAVKEQVLELEKIGKIPASSVRWALVNENGVIEEQSGGFAVLSKPGFNGQPATNPNIYIDAGSSLLGHGLTATTAIQNRLDRGGSPDPDPAFAGDVAVGRCNTAAINCVPAGTNADDVLVVRSLADNGDVMSQTRRFYVKVTE
ncbi:MAG: hypothetical protein M3356_00345, partial [Actinomycetota bacterium]|nr:hypothetical protein [Actinomycetota bacterium]